MTRRKEKTRSCLPRIKIQVSGTLSGKKTKVISKFYNCKQPTNHSKDCPGHRDHAYNPIKRNGVTIRRIKNSTGETDEIWM